MLLLNEGQRPLLDFLRNLTPQALLVTTGLVLAKPLDFHHIDWRNWFETLSCFLCFGFALLAFLANLNQYFDALLDALDGFNRIGRRLRRAGVHPRPAGCATLAILMKRRPTVFFDFVASIALVNLAWVVILLAAFSAARAAFR